MNFKKKNWKKRRTEETNTLWWSKKKEYGVSFVYWGSFKTNQRVILFRRELVSRSRNLNQCKSRSLLEEEDIST